MANSTLLNAEELKSGSNPRTCLGCYRPFAKSELTTDHKHRCLDCLLLESEAFSDFTEVKLCNYCSHYKPRADFRKKRAQCRDCRNIEKKATYYADREHILELQKAAIARNPERKRNSNRKYKANNAEACRKKDSDRYYRLREEYIELKSDPCLDCKRTFPPECMDFDHVRGEKTDCVSRLVTYTPDVLKEEIAKTELVCACCHRIRTASRSTKEIFALTRVSHLIDQIKDNANCSDCSLKYPGICYDFDHRDPSTKEFEISQVRRWSTKHTDLLLKEIAKCDIRCVNCHRIKTMKERGIKEDGQRDAA